MLVSTFYLRFSPDSSGLTFGIGNASLGTLADTFTHNGLYPTAFILPRATGYSQLSFLTNMTKKIIIITLYTLKRSRDMLGYMIKPHSATERIEEHDSKMTAKGREVQIRHGLQEVDISHR